MNYCLHVAQALHGKDNLIPPRLIVVEIVGPGGTKHWCGIQGSSVIVADPECVSKAS